MHSPIHHNNLTRVALFLLSTLILGHTLAEEKVTYYEHDAFGNIVAATDENGEILWKEHYDPYGNRLVRDRAGNDHRIWYSGHQETDFGLLYMGARHYDPTVGRFLSVDPLSFNQGNIQSFNRYAYANNNPYRFVDPDGREPVVGDTVNQMPLPFPLPGLGGGTPAIPNPDKLLRDLGVGVNQQDESVRRWVSEAAEEGRTSGEAARRASNSGRQFWTKSTTFRGSVVYQRDDLIDPEIEDARGRTNRERMARGLAPIGPDEKPINLHHMTQSQRGGIAEVTQTFHQQNSRNIHINPSSVPSGIDRDEFDTWRRDYWKARANDF